MAFDVARIRGLFPALGDGWIHLDAPAGMQVPEQVATAVSTALRAPVSGPGGVFPASQRAEAIVDAARRAVADLVGADPAGVVLGPSSAVLLARLADALGAGWLIGDEVVVSRLDHPANIAPWQRAAQRCGGIVRWAEIDIETCELPAWQYDDLVSGTHEGGRHHGRVRRGRHPAGPAPDRRDRSARRRAGRRGRVVGGAVHAAGHGHPGRGHRGAVGQRVGRTAGRRAGVPRSGAAGPAAVVLAGTGRQGPERLELGPHPYPLLAGLVASVDYLAELDDAASGPRRERLLTSMGSMKSYQAGLLAGLISELRSLRNVMVIGDAMRRVPALAFAVAGVRAEDAVEHLGKRGICAFADNGHNGVFAALGVGEIGGAVRVGLAHYTNAVEVDQLVRSVAELG